MPVSRLGSYALLAIVSAAAASGCRTAGVNDLARPDPPLSASSAAVSEILAEHNRNAEQIKVLDAQPDLTVTVYQQNGAPKSYSVGGRMTLERPRNFSLRLESVASTGSVADIGSNDAEYWFWVKDKTQRAIYYCKHDEAETSSMAASLQPDWIIEAMGLRVIPESEAAEITMKTDKDGQIVLTHRPHKFGKQTYTRVTILDPTTHRIREHQLRSGDQKTLLARAVVPEGYLDIKLPAENGAETPAPAATISIPKRLKLFWIQEKLDLDATFPIRTVRINNPIKQSRREYLFVEPQPGRGYDRINLAEKTSETTIRESRPAPPSPTRSGVFGFGTGIRLREPTPIEDGPAASNAFRRRSDQPIDLGGSSPVTPSLTEDMIGARFPTAPDPGFAPPEPASSFNPAFP